MAKRPKIDDRTFKSVVEKLVDAGWIEKVVVVDPKPTERGKAQIRFTQYGTDMLTAFKTVHDELGKFTEQEWGALYKMMLNWICRSPERFGIEPPSGESA
jgi:hypothetical protein